MSKFTKEMVDMYADKLLIGLTNEENKMVLNEFDIIDKQMEVIANLKKIEEVEPMSYALDDFAFTLKDDVAQNSPDIKDLLKNCSSHEDGFVSVIKVVN